MTPIRVNVVDLGAAATAGAVRVELPSGPLILLHYRQPVDEQSALLAELTHDGEVAVIVPDQRDPEPSQIARHLRVAAAVALPVVIAACTAPPVAG